jgi:hypothetical protein
VARTIEYADVTGSEWRSSAYPEIVHLLGPLGHRVLGRVAQRSSGGSDSQFDREGRTRLNAWRTRPASTLLAASDGESYVSVDQYGDAPVVRLRTAFTDGSMVETVGLTCHGMLRPRAGLDPFQGFTLGAATGRTVQLVTDLPVADVVRTHRDRVVAASGSARPRSHRDLADAVELWNGAARHTLDTSRALTRWRRLIGLGWLLVALAPAALLVLTLLSGRGVDSAPLAVPLGVLAVLVTAPLLVAPIRACDRALVRARWWRPAYPR